MLNYHDYYYENYYQIKGILTSLMLLLFIREN